MRIKSSRKSFIKNKIKKKRKKKTSIDWLKRGETRERERERVRMILPIESRRAWISASTDLYDRAGPQPKPVARSPSPWGSNPEPLPEAREIRRAFEKQSKDHQNSDLRNTEMARGCFRYSISLSLTCPNPPLSFTWIKGKKKGNIKKRTEPKPRKEKTENHNFYNKDAVFFFFLPFSELERPTCERSSKKAFSSPVEIEREKEKKSYIRIERERNRRNEIKKRRKKEEKGKTEAEIGSWETKESHSLGEEDAPDPHK